MTNQRDYSIDILKFIAVILITNSHMDIHFPESLKCLGTGGAIGDALFFFCSGFTLFLKPMGSFDSWYKKRIMRIYPSVLMWGVISAFLFSSSTSMDKIILHGGGWFVSCIMLYYILAYMVDRFYPSRYRWLIFILVYGITATIYCCINRGGEYTYNIYGSGYLKWVFFFLFMLLGAEMGTRKQMRKLSFYSGVTLCLTSIFLFYSSQYLVRSGIIHHSIQLISIAFLMLTVYFLYLTCNTDFIRKVFFSKANFIIMLIGGLCLEIYIVQSKIIVIAPIFPDIFPLNILFVWASIVVGGYILRCLARIFQQTFNKGEYDWKEVFKLV